LKHPRREIQLQQSQKISQKVQPESQESNGKPQKVQNASQKTKQGSYQSLKETEEKQRIDNLQQIYNNYVFPWNIRPNFSMFLSFPFVRDLRLSQLILRNPLNEVSNDELLQKDLDSWRIQAINRARDLIGRFRDGQSTSSINTKRIDQGIRDNVKEVDLPVHNNDPQDEGIPLLKKKARATVKVVDPIEQPQKKPNNPRVELLATAWFICRSCPYLEPAYERLGVLDFAGICAHQCQTPYVAVSTSVGWNVCESRHFIVSAERNLCYEDNFLLAPHAVAITREMLKVLGIHEEDSTSAKECFAGLWFCKICPKVKELQWEDLVSTFVVRYTERILNLGQIYHYRLHSSHGITPRVDYAPDSHRIEHREPQKSGQGNVNRLICGICLPKDVLMHRLKRDPSRRFDDAYAHILMDRDITGLHMKQK
jgi:hypothetical protein